MSSSALASSSVPTNWKSNINQVVKGYESEPAKGLVHGLQKDFIQNSWGQRVDLEMGKNWRMDFTLVKNDHGKFLLVHDYGTNGMTGPNLSMTEISRLATDLPPDYRLARFSAMNYSGGNEGAGLYGRGKLLFSAASEIGYYIYETLTQEEGYRVNYKKLEGNDLRVGESALQGEDAINYLTETTGLMPISSQGSRIIVISPIDALVTAIDDGIFIKDIEETWWRIIKKFNAKIKVQKYDGTCEFAKIPVEYQENLNEFRRNFKIQIPGYSKVTEIGLGISNNDIREDLRNVYLYRKNMKLAEIPLSIPEELQNRYFGYVEVDEDFEDEIINIEDLEHYGFTSKKSKVFQQLKLTVSNEHDTWMEELGYVNRRIAQDENLQNELLEVSTELDEFLTAMDFGGDIDSGNQMPKCQLKWEGIKFPENKGNRLTFGDIISDIRFSIKNNYTVPKDFKVRLAIKCENSTLIDLSDTTVRIGAGEKLTYGPFEFEVNEALKRFKKHSIVLEVFPVRSTKVEKIEALFYYDVEQIVKEQRQFALKLISIELPNENSRRVDTGQRITNIAYKIINNSAHHATLALNITTYMGDRENDSLENTFLRRDIEVEAHKEVIVHCTDIEFSKEAYEDRILKGPIEIRTTLSAANDFSIYEMGDIICKNPPLVVYLNQEGGFISQTFNDVQMIEGDEYRSYANGKKGDWTFSLYKDHPSYMRIMEDDDLRKEYLIEEMLKQTMRVHLSDGNYSILAMFSEDLSDIEDLSYAELLHYSYSVIDKIQLKRQQNQGALTHG
ncbi:hypothetical protein [Sporosarcina sp. Marseille-Q4943]|uniref:hypothetical protein n=1 Tax=Sporosarcina sp. Marseille-Q4943 TaxID=2942204 RepID=UPI00208DB2F2|nr:hypothetical protein [Sporosarcina sp. Marseille-Q4943]